MGYFGRNTRVGLGKYQADREVIPSQPALYDEATRLALLEGLDEHYSNQADDDDDEAQKSRL